jgi:hypothetical protein
MLMYGKPMPKAIRQNNLSFIVVYNPKDSPELLFKQCADHQEIPIITKVSCTTEQMLMNIVDLFTCCSLYSCNMDNWDQKPNANKTYLLFSPFIQDTYQRCYASGTITASQGGYSTANPFVGLTAKDNVSDKDTAETITRAINLRMANLSTGLSAQMTASTKVNALQINGLLQQVEANNNKLN